jgi:hypothetical protein
MLTTKFLINDVYQVPVSFVFEHFCKLPQKLTGQDIKIKSLWKDERTPSMCIYMDKNKKTYRFKDFSTGKSGDAYDLVKQLYNVEFSTAARTIVEAYNEYTLHNNGGYDVEDFKHYQKYKVDNHAVRLWNSQDQYYWTQFNIGTRLLTEHHVAPLDFYHMSKIDENGELKELTIRGPYIYGYFRKDGTLYKVYQPKVKDKKFIKVSGYIQGSEQLQGHQVLIITSSLKDIMSLKSLKLNIDYVAPDSENTMIRKEIIEKYLEDYRLVMVMFDNDEAGIRSMEKYRDTYPVRAAILPLSKDPSDSFRDFGVKKVRQVLIPIINRNLSTVMELV